MMSNFIARTMGRVTLILAGAAAVLALIASRRRSARRAPPLSCAKGGPLVVVVGLGGVGSHAAHLLLRGGIRRLRLIDFDQVTLSSLNRHATATRADVGTPKVVALRAQLLRIAPDAEVDACTELFCAARADDLLEGGAALVIDCIDDLATKTVSPLVRGRCRGSAASSWVARPWRAHRPHDPIRSHTAAGHTLALVHTAAIAHTVAGAHRALRGRGPPCHQRPWGGGEGQPVPAARKPARGRIQRSHWHGTAEAAEEAEAGGQR